MISRFVTRRQNNGEYYVWDNETGAVALTADGHIRYENFGFNQAIDAAIELNGPSRAVGLTPEAPQQVAQQQQQPQPKKE
jgi:hypothetical protein